jgi:hypothetical protein
MAVAIERYLKDFGQPEPFVLTGDLDARDEPSQLKSLEPAPAVVPVPSEPEFDIEAERSAALELGKQQAAETLAAEHQTELEAERSRHLEEINEMRTRFEQDFSTTLAARFDQLAIEMSETIGEQVARIVAPFLEQALSERMVAQLGTAIAGSLADGEATRIAVSGSPSMFEALSTALGDKAAQLDFSESETFDLTVRLDDTVLSTRLSEWASTLREVLS